jgi:hypothetical protein
MSSEADLSPQIRTVLSQVDDPALRAQVEAVTCRSLEALAAFSRIHLPQDNFVIEATDQVMQQHVELAPYVAAAVAACKRLIQTIAEQFPGDLTPQEDVDFDVQFDLLETRGAMVREDILLLAPGEEVAEIVRACGGMLKRRLNNFGERLQKTVAKGDSWSLLAELDDSLRSLSKAVQGILFGTLSVFSPELKRESIWPEYHSAAHDAEALVTALADLNYHISRFNQALAVADPAQMVALVVGVADRVGRFAARREYRSLPAQEKKAVIDFCTRLFKLRQRPEIDPGELRRTVEGFSKFLEVMQDMSRGN